jgi:hypothetical protein
VKAGLDCRAPGSDWSECLGAGLGARLRPLQAAESREGGARAAVAAAAQVNGRRGHFFGGAGEASSGNLGWKALGLPLLPGCTGRRLEGRFSKVSGLASGGPGLLGPGPPLHLGSGGPGALRGGLGLVTPGREARELATQLLLEGRVVHVPAPLARLPAAPL